MVCQKCKHSSAGRASLRSQQSKSLNFRRRQSRQDRGLFAQTPCIRFEIGHLSGRLKADFHSDQMELAMRTVVVVFAALMTLGLVAFGVVIVQKGSDPVALTKATAGVGSPPKEGAKSGKTPLYLGAARKAAGPLLSSPPPPTQPI